MNYEKRYSFSFSLVCYLLEEEEEDSSQEESKLEQQPPHNNYPEGKLFFYSNY